MGGASDVPPGDPNAAPMGDPGMGDPGMGGDPMGGDPGMGNMNDGQLDPPDMGGDMGGEPGPLDGAPMGAEGEGEGDDSTMSIINQLSPEDREAVRSYAESMLSRDETKGEDMGGEEPPMDGGEAPMGGDPGMGPDPNGGAPMMESFVFSKKQIRSINENLPVTDLKKREDKVNDKKKGNNTPKKSPFNSPKFK